TIDNTATASGTAANGTSVTDTGTASVGIARAPGINIEKSTNGQDADSSSGPVLLVGSTATWTYTVTNTGNTTLYNVLVTDDVIGTIGTIASVAPGDTAVLSTTGTVIAGQYANTGTASVADLFAGTVSDSDPSHYFGADPSLSIDKVTIDQNGNVGDSLGVLAGSDVTWQYTVTNTGNVAIGNIVVDDDQLSGVDDPVYVSGDTNKNGLLDLSEAWVYTATGTAIDNTTGTNVAKYTNTGTATGTFTDDAGTTANVSDSDDSAYYVLDPGYVTNSSLFDFGDIFNLIFTPAFQYGSNMYKLSDSNPGQFYYNTFFDAADPDGDPMTDDAGTVTIDVPYPFVTQGANPIHWYTGVTVDDSSGAISFDPGTAAGSQASTFTIGDYTDTNGDGVVGFGDTYTVTVSGLPTDGFVYLNMHMDFSLEKTAPWLRSGENALNDVILSYDDIMEFMNFMFDSSVNGSSDTISNDNIFKNIRGIGGLVTFDGTDSSGNSLSFGLENQSILFTKAGDTSVIEQALTDADGWFFGTGVAKGKQQDYDVWWDVNANGIIDGGDQQQTVTLGGKIKFAEADWTLDQVTGYDPSTGDYLVDDFMLI
ncbi:MAG: hypothetical protein B7Z02_03725, partial [Rhodobacterales bacterium 32-67-9]